jgi:hypothetical protein
MVSQSRTTARVPAGGVLDGVADVIRVGEKHARFHAQHADPGHGLVVGMVCHVSPLAAAAGDLTQDGHVRPGHPVEQEQQRVGDADDQAGQGVEDQDPEHGGDSGEEVGAGGQAVDLPEPGGGGRYSVASAGKSTSSISAAITTAARVASGRSSNNPVKNSSVITVSTATTSPEA